MPLDVKKIKICTSVINHTSNWKYSAVMIMRVIFCLQQGKDKPTKANYQRFEAAISTSDFEKCTATTHMELSKTYTWGNEDNGTKIFEAM